MPPTPAEAKEARYKSVEKLRELGAVGATVLSVVGAALLGFSFLATGSQMAVVSGDIWSAESRTYEPYVALCTDEKLVVLKYRDQGGGTNLGGKCPDGARHPIAEVTHESSTLFLWGWLAVIGSAFWQVRLATLPALPAKWG